MKKKKGSASRKEGKRYFLVGSKSEMRLFVKENASMKGREEAKR